MKINSIQHDNVDITDLRGVRCESLLAVCLGDEFCFAYISAEGTWLRFFLDEGVLFLSECEGPDPDDDLSNEHDEPHSYFDALEAMGGSEEIERMWFESGRLTLSLRGGAHFTAFLDGDGVVCKVAGRRPAAQDQ